MAKLSEEIGAWGWNAPFAYRGSEEALVEDTDPFARLEGQTSAHFYRAAEATCPLLGFGARAVENRVLSEGWVIKPGKAGGTDARDLADWVASWLGRRELRFDAALQLLTTYLFYGWHPYNVTWRDWTWRRHGARSDRADKVPARIIDKDGRMFRFNVGRNLVFTGFGADNQVFPIAEDSAAGTEARMRWLTPRIGSEDVPYGAGIYRRSGAAATYLLWRDLWKQYQLGLDRSMGILQVEKTAEGLGAGISDAEIASQMTAVVARLRNDGWLKPPDGYKLSWMENAVQYASGWKDPLDRLEALIALSVTGQGLSVGMGRGGAAGSRAAAEVEEGRSARWGRGCAQNLANTVSGLIDLAVEWNHGDVPEDLRPSLMFRSQQHIEVEKLQTYLDLAVGDPAADPPDWETISDDWGIPTRRGGEWSARPTEPVPVAFKEDEDREEPEEESEAA